MSCGRTGLTSPSSASPREYVPARAERSAHAAEATTLTSRRSVVACDRRGIARHRRRSVRARHRSAPTDTVAANLRAGNRLPRTPLRGGRWRQPGCDDVRLGRRVSSQPRARAGVAAGRALIGGVGYRWSGDGPFGLVVSDLLATRDWPPGVDVEDLGYGALHVSLDLADADPLRAGHPHRRRRAGPRARTAVPAPVRADGARHRGGPGPDVRGQRQRHRPRPPAGDRPLLRRPSARPREHRLKPYPGTTGDQLSPQAQALIPDAVELVRREVLATARTPSA